jgi:hypothetical protein
MDAADVQRTMAPRACPQLCWIGAAERSSSEQPRGSTPRVVIE